MRMTLRRWWYTLRSFRNYPKELNRRAAVEQELWNAAAGRVPPPDAEKCREWALRLGVPEEFRR